MKFRFFHLILYVIAIGFILSFALCRGDKTELNYYDFAERVTYNKDRDSRVSDPRYTNIGLSEEKRNGIKNIMENFDLSCFLKNPYDIEMSQVMNYYYIIISIKNEPYILTIIDCGSIDKNSFKLNKTDRVDSRFYYKDRTRNPTIYFKNRELSKRLDDFIRKNKSIIDRKMSNIKQQQPKYSSPMIQQLHERYCETADRVENWAYDLYYRLTHP